MFGSVLWLNRIREPRTPRAFAWSEHRGGVSRQRAAQGTEPRRMRRGSSCQGLRDQPSSSLWLDCRHDREICQIGRIQPENLQVLFGIPILLGLGGTPCVEAGVTAEDGPNSRDRGCRSYTGGLGSAARADESGGVCHGGLIFSARRSSP